MRTFIPFAAFFASGASSLIFQAIWTRMLHHVFGATSVAMSTVLSAFMGGLGLGAYWFGKRAARFRRPLAVYAACELGVALTALLLPWLLSADGFLATLNAWLRVSVGAGSVLFMLARFLCVVPLLIVPTTLMGGTLPLLAQHFVKNEDDADGTGARVGSLYAVNTLGAVFGTLLGNFVLLPAIGVARTHEVAIGMNVALGLSVLVLLAKATGANTTAPREPLELHSADQASNTIFDTRVQKLAVFTFGISGACALLYEVVWSRALAMAIGSSMQSFALILVTFLVGIAIGSAYVSSLLSPHAARRFRHSIIPNLVVALVLCALALLPRAVLNGVSGALLGLLAYALVAGGIAYAARQRAHAEQALEADPSVVLKRGALLLLALPCIAALFECVRFATTRSTLPSIALHGYLPFVAAAVVCVIACSAMLAVLLRDNLPALSGAIQLCIAVATLVSYIVQDEIPYVFARMVSALEDLHEHVTLVRFFMFVTAGLCTLPATLSMGAMFPITLRLFTAGGREVGREVAIVYSANTLGSICGAWLPGFLLMPLLGMETTLHAGMLLNILLALAMLLVARSTRSAPVHEGLEGELSPRPTFFAPLLGAALVTAAIILFFALPKGAPLRWDLSHMTLGAFRVSLARDVLDRGSWGEPDLVYYRDGVSTTVSVERWGRHLSLKNNGKVDASNGDDMATQIMVAAYPLLLHPKHGKDLDVAVVGFGSGVTVGAALQFPVRHIDAMELEEGVVDAASLFFSDVNHFNRTDAHFPFVSAPRLSLFNDDGRNFLASTGKSYDVILSEPSNPWITGVSDLFTTEHFRISKKRLKPGGVYCQWVQLYEMSPANVKTIYRTFASQFKYVMAFAAEELSSDTVLIGSDVPLQLDVDALYQAMSPASVAAELARAYVTSPYDVLARVLFAEKREIMAFTHLEERREKGVWVEQIHAMGDAPCHAPDCVRTRAVLNTDDNMWIELNAPRDLIGFARYQGYLRSFYGPKFPYGKLLGRITGLDSDERRAAFSLSLLAHGRKTRAAEVVRSIRTREGPDVRRAGKIVELFAEGTPEPDVNLTVRFDAPHLDASAREELSRVQALIEDHLHARRFAEALALLSALDPLFVERGPAPVHALYGYLSYKAARGDRTRLRTATAKLEAALRTDERFARAHPELLFFLARAHDALASFHKAADTMSLFVARSEAH